MSLPNGVDTKVGEEGSNINWPISKIGIARALYNDPSIILFDETTSSLDVNTENEVMKSIDFEEIKVILITHRISTLKMLM